MKINLGEVAGTRFKIWRTSTFFLLADPTRYWALFLEAFEIFKNVFLALWTLQVGGPKSPFCRRDSHKIWVFSVRNSPQWKGADICARKQVTKAVLSLIKFDLLDSA